jgi:hypothetical protein
LQGPIYKTLHGSSLTAHTYLHIVISWDGLLASVCTSSASKYGFAKH